MDTNNPLPEKVNSLAVLVMCCLLCMCGCCLHGTLYDCAQSQMAFECEILPLLSKFVTMASDAECYDKKDFTTEILYVQLDLASLSFRW